MSTTAFLDTSVIISKNFDTYTIKERIKDKLREFETTLTSTYVVMEFKRRVLKDLIFLHSICLEEENLADVQRRLSKICRTNRQLKMSLLLFAELSTISSQNMDEIVLKLENMVRFYRLYFQPTKIRQSKSFCQLADCEPHKTEEGNYEFHPNWSCTRKIIQCRIDDFVRTNHKHLDLLLRCLPKDKKWSKFKTVLKRILRNPNVIRGNNCMTFGDTIIIFDAPMNSTILSTNRGDFEPICRCLDRSYVNISVN